MERFDKYIVELDALSSFSENQSLYLPSNPFGVKRLEKNKTSGDILPNKIKFNLHNVNQKEASTQESFAHKSEAYHLSSLKAHYIRYGDNFLLGVNGSYQDCVKILANLQNFLKKDCDISLTPPVGLEIINIKTAKSLIFLGVLVYVRDFQLEVPINLIRNRLTNGGFLKDRKSVPKLE